MNNYILKQIKASTSLLNIAASLYSFPSYFLRKGTKSNEIHAKGAFLKHTKIHIKGYNNSIIILPENRLINCLIYIKGNNCTIEIGKHCILSNTELWIEDDEGKIKVGYRTTMEGGHIAAREGKMITIREDCMFSHRIEIRNGDSHAIFDNNSKQRVNSARSINIGNHVWLGADAKILKGSNIADGAIIATGAIVSGHVVENSIYAGIPAKKVKENIHWERERK